MAKKREKSPKQASVALENYDGAWDSNPEAGTRKTLEIAGVEWAFRYCPPGTFGGGDVKKGANPYKITLTRGFWIAETPTTQAQYEALIGENPSFFSPLRIARITDEERAKREEEIARGAWYPEKVRAEEAEEEARIAALDPLETRDFPVETVSWHDATNCAQKATEAAALPDGFVLRLPTEAEWEYACRAGTETAFFWGTRPKRSALNCEPTYGPERKPSDPEPLKRTSRVRSYPPNPWGVYDAHGNVREWVFDLDGPYWLGSNRAGEKTDPAGPPRGRRSYERRTHRGGAWNSRFFDECASGYSDVAYSTERYKTYGFRLALGRPTAEPTKPPRVKKSKLAATRRQKLADDWTRSPEDGTRQTFEFDGVEFAFRFCPAGTFTMGPRPEYVRKSKPKKEREEEIREQRRCKVTLTRGFWTLETPVTQAQYETLIGENPSFFADSDSVPDFHAESFAKFHMKASGVDWGPFFHEPNGGAGVVRGVDTSEFPVENLAFEDCLEFLAELNALVAPPDGWVFRLLTDAEWEYACRAGTETPFPWGSSLNGDKANCRGTFQYGTREKGPWLRRTTQVRSYPPNPWGLYDMNGNVWEFCSDWRGPAPEGVATDPTGPAKQADDCRQKRILRGGSWEASAEACLSSVRGQSDSYEYFSDGTVGFRIALGRPY
ncbi:MAG: SUMF1/EgtB/PvdO family nonheme iron enzyme [Thermoguttaceae bacterium]|nr:SUMF1/EgtB/PvdO family nonheme iron enzyme [Thermoguttaceae bacterium]